VELHGKATALEDLLVGGFDSLSGVVGVLELDVAEAGEVTLVHACIGQLDRWF
jgi:hypothetical protein